ncbi:Gustatory receptor 40 [Hyalella azteca]|uniref:Gustatory receptor 40 n=1 Tax=Hyalella azteca TaxID=294128 RepID=A0A6A0HA39_HYAAZ|nr:Gustatory receptor 40 [Hyalella azteca]
MEMKPVFLLLLRLMQVLLCLPYKFVRSYKSCHSNTVKFKRSEGIDHFTKIVASCLLCLSAMQLVDDLVTTEIESTMEFLLISLHFLNQIGFMTITSYCIHQHRILKFASKSLLLILNNHQELSVADALLWILFTCPCVLIIFVVYPRFYASNIRNFIYLPLHAFRILLILFIPFFFNVGLYISNHYVRQWMTKLGNDISARVQQSSGSNARTKPNPHKDLDISLLLCHAGRITLTSEQVCRTFETFLRTRRTLQLLYCFCRLPMAVAVSIDLLELIFSVSGFTIMTAKMSDILFASNSFARIAMILTAPAGIQKSLREAEHLLRLLHVRVQAAAKPKIMAGIEVIETMPDFSIYGLFTLGPHAILPVLSTVATYVLVNYQASQSRL